MIKRILLIFTVMCFLYNGTAGAYEDKITHPALTEEAVEKSDLSEFLQNYMGIASGIDEKFSDGKKRHEIIWWLKYGSTNEDVGFRASNHFYDPTRNSGVDDVAIEKK